MKITKTKISLFLGAASLALLLPHVLAFGDAAELRPASEFAEIDDPAERSAALFIEAGKVLQHPRCVNCHPSGDVPLQGEAGTLHQPPVVRGKAGFGVPGLRCNTCHQKANFDPGRVPGASPWLLAPRKMAWEGLSLGEICEQLKDPKRNGGRDLEAVARHLEEDELVAWGWNPGTAREPVPGTQKEFGALIHAWIEAGAHCPE